MIHYVAVTSWLSSRRVESRSLDAPLKHIDQFFMGNSTGSPLSIAPLYNACRQGNEQRVRQLLPNYSAKDLNQQDSSNDENTCLHIATAQGHDRIVQLLIEHGCYRSSILNAQHQSPYDLAANGKDSTRSLFLRQEASNHSSRFQEQNADECFDIVRVEDDEPPPPVETENQPTKKVATTRSSVQTFQTEEEKAHEMQYSASSKAMCQSRLARFCVNQFHRDEPLDHRTILQRINQLLTSVRSHPSDDSTKAEDLVKQYEKNGSSIEQLLHLYTLETDFYRMLKGDSLPLAIPLFIHLPALKDRHFKGCVYRGMRMTTEQLSIYQLAMQSPATLLQTRSFSSTSIDQSIAEDFAWQKSSKSADDLSVLFVFDFPQFCDQAINLSRISLEKPCLSEYADEAEVLILPWTLFQVMKVQLPTNEKELTKIFLNNVIIPKKNLLSTFKWSWTEMKNQLRKDKKITFNCAFQKYQTTGTKNK